MATANPSSPFSYASDNPLAPEFLALERQKKMADLLLQKGQQQPQGEMVSGHYVAPSWAQQLNPLVNSYISGNLSQQNEAKTAELAKLLRGQNATETQDILEKQFGSPDYKAAEMPQIQRDDLGQLMPPVNAQVGKAPNPQAALLAGLNATGPTGQAIGQTLLAQKLKPPEEFNLGAEETRYRAGPNGTVQQIATGKGKIEKPPVSYQEFLLAKQEGFKGSYNDYQTLDANRKRAVTNVTTNVMGGEKQYDKTFGEEVAKQDIALKATAENAPNTLANIKRQQNLLEKGGVITGVGANQRLDIARLGQSLGLTGKNVVADTQQFYAGRAGSVLDSIKSSGLGAGNGFTNKDLEFLEKAKLGGIVFDAESLRRQLQIEDNVTRAIVARYNQRVKDMPIAGGLKLNPINVEGGVTYLGPVK